MLTLAELEASGDRPLQPSVGSVTIPADFAEPDIAVAHMACAAVNGPYGGQWHQARAFESASAAGRLPIRRTMGIAACTVAEVLAEQGRHGQATGWGRDAVELIKRGHGTLALQAMAEALAGREAYLADQPRNAVKYLTHTLVHMRELGRYDEECGAAMLLVENLEEVPDADLDDLFPEPPELDEEPEADDLSCMLYGGAIAYRRLRHPQRALALLEILQKRLGGGPSILLAKAVSQVGAIKRDCGDLADAIALHRQAVEIAVASRNNAPGSEAVLQGHAAEAMVVAEHPEADAALLEAASAGENARHRGLATSSFVELASRQIDPDLNGTEEGFRRASVALSYLQHARRNAEAMDCINPRCSGHTAELLPITVLEAHALFQQGNREGALELQLDACSLAARGDIWTRADCALEAADLLLLLDRPDDAYTQTQTILSEVARTEFTQVELTARAAELARRAQVIEVSALARSDDAANQRQAHALGHAMLISAQSRGDHVLAGQVRAAMSAGAQLEYEPEASDGPQEVVEDAFRLPLAAADLWHAAMLRDDGDREGIDAVMALYEEALGHVVRADGSVEQEYADGMCAIVIALAGLRLSQGHNILPVLGLIESALAVASRPGQRIRLLQVRAEALHFSGSLHGAIASYDAVLEELSDDDFEARGMMLSKLSGLHLRLGEVGEATRRLDEVDNVDSFTAEARSFVVHARAGIEGALGHDHRQVELLEEALELGPDGAHHARAMVLVDLAHATSHFDPGAAIPIYQQAISIIEHTADRRHLVPALEGLLHSRIASDADLPEERMFADFERILEMRRANGDSEGEIVTMLNFAAHLASTDKPEHARDVYEEASRMSRVMGSTGTLVTALVGRARLADESEHEDPGGLIAISEACDLIEAQVDSLTTADDRVDALAERTAAPSLAVAIHVSADDARGAFAASERFRALGLKDLITDQDLRDASPPDVRAEEDAAYARLTRLWENPEGGARRGSEVIAAERELRIVQDRLRAALPILERAKQLPVPTMEELLAGPLADGSALLAYTFVDDDDLVAFCIADGRMQVNRALGASGVAYRAREFATSIAGDLPRPLHAHTLYRMLLEPFAETIAGRPLVIVPDGALHGLPFAALMTQPYDEHDETLEQLFAERCEEKWVPAEVSLEVMTEDLRKMPHSRRRIRPEASPWLVMSHSVRVVPSAAVLLDLHRRPTAEYPSELGIFAVPGPEEVEPATEAATRRVTGQSDLEPLRHAREEALAILASLGGRDGHRGLQTAAQLRIGSDATIEAFEKLAGGGTRWLHLACHAVVDAERPWTSAILLADDGDTGPALRAAGILRRRFPSELVVLSCCETGLGRVVPGEGVLGLSRAFLAAGARSVCATLWPVRDDAGPALMSHLYPELQRGAKPWDALRAAQIRQASDGVSPNRWAGYTIIG